MKIKKVLKAKTEDKIDEKVEVSSTPKFKDLRDVMDYSRKLAIHYSGVENEDYLDILYGLGIRNFLMSYEYLKTKGRDKLAKYSDMSLFIDSGAYTYMNDPKYEKYTIEQWERQIEEYLDWARRHKDSIFAICDLDLQYIVGNEKVYEWRRKYFEPFMLETGIPVCFMYHDEGIEQWEHMCKRYPYVGLSLAIDKKTHGRDELLEMFRVAEKHNALCQGMASTNTSMLVDFPFYTVDSTTWNVGLKYGEISVWDGNKMRRFKKEDFENRAWEYINKYDYPFSLEKIVAEDKTEMIKVNAFAFIEAEKYVHERLSAKMYWLKAKTNKVDINNLPEDFFPPLEWFENPEGLEEYAEKMNINPEYEGAKDMIYDVTAFLNWDNEEYQEMHETYLNEEGKLLIDLHDAHVNRIVPNEQVMIEDLISFYESCVSGENDKLLLLGTNFDRVIHERDSYIEEDTHDIVDLDEEEIRSRLQGILPSPEDSEDPAPDISALEDEVFKDLDIIPVRDEQGKFLKGQTAVKRPKNLYSKKFPKLACDTCYAAARCPEYRQGFVCAFSKMFDRYNTRDMGDIIESMQGIVAHNMTRMQKAMVMETLNGTIDPIVSQLMDTNMRYMQQLKQMYEYGSPEVLRKTTTVRADGTTEETTQITNPQEGGILEKLFSMQTKPHEIEDEENRRNNSREDVIDEEDIIEVDIEDFEEVED